MNYLRLNSKKGLLYSDITERSFVITGDTLNIIRDFFKIGKINAKDMIKSNDIEKKAIVQFLIEKGILVYKNSNLFFRNCINVRDDIDVQDIPTVLYLLITNGCNFKCKHCCWEDHYKKEQELTVKQLKKLVDDMTQLGIFRLSISGGEPMVRYNDLIELVKYAKSKGITSICIASNGQLVNKQKIEELYNAGVTELQFSIDHYNKDIHNGGRAPGNLEHIEMIAKIIKEEYVGKLNVSAGLTLTNKNKNDIFDIINYVVGLGINKMKVVRFTGITEQSRNDGFAITNVEDIKNISCKLVEKADELKKNNVIIKLSSMISTNAYICGKNPNFKRSKNCEALRQRICVKSDGEVSPCPLLSSYDISVGNVKNESLIDILLGSKAQEFKKIYKDNSKCQNCKHYNICGGGCLASSISKNGVMNGCDEWCIM